MGKPEYLSHSIVTELDVASDLSKSVQPVTFQDGHLCLRVTMPPPSVAALEFAY
jgi:hypothetical protein